MARKAKTSGDDGADESASVDAGPSKADRKQAKKAAKTERKQTIAVRSVAKPALVGALLLTVAAQFLPG